MSYDFSKLIEMAKELGAAESKVIEAKTIKTAPFVAMKCRYGCDRYNTSLCCPPYTPSYKETSEVINCYKTALLIKCKSNVNPTTIALKLERKAFLMGFYKALSYGAGHCTLCNSCNIKRCCHPEDARPSMEACGIDVFETIRTNGFHVKVLNEKDAEVSWYSLLLIE